MGILVFILVIIAVGIPLLMVWGKNEQERQKVEEKNKYEAEVQKYMNQYRSYSKQQLESKLNSVSMSMSQANIQVLSTNNYIMAKTASDIRDGYKAEKEAIEKLLKQKS